MKKVFIIVAVISLLALSSSVFADEVLPSPKNASSVAAMHNDEGISHFKEGHWNVAIGHFKEAVDADSEFAVGYYNLAMAFHKAGNHRKATNYFKKAAKLAPNNSHIQNSKVLREHIGK